MRALVAGSRLLPPGGAGRVAEGVRGLLAGGGSLVLGCAAGADAAALSAVVGAGAGSRLSVLAAFGPPSGAPLAAPGAWSGSAVPEVARAWRAGAAVSWWAGGGPGVPLRARLAARSLAAVRFAAAGGPGSSALVFVGALPPRPFAGSGPWRSCGSGSWSAACAAALLGVPVVVVPLGDLAGVPPSAWPALSGAGSWGPVSAGPGVGGFQWVPAL